MRRTFGRLRGRSRSRRSAWRAAGAARRLREQGVLTDEEFAAEKAALVRG